MILQVKNWYIILILGLEMLNCHTNGTGNVAIYVFSLGKFINARVYACEKNLTNIMSVYCIGCVLCGWGEINCHWNMETVF